MSAWIVSKRHIDVLVQAGWSARRDDRLRWYHGGNPHELDYDNRDAVGRMLWLENHKSVDYRYPGEEDGQLPGPVGLKRADIEAYTFHLAYRSDRKLSLAALLKAIDAYEYQACEHDGWETSEARTYCQSLRKHLIRQLPGYEEAEWGL